VHYLCKLLIYGHQICITGASDVNAATELPRFDVLFEVTGVKCINPIMADQPGWHKS